MKKIKNKKFLKSIAVALSLLCLSSCGTTESPANSVADYVDVWTTYGISKILQNQRTEAEATYYDLGDSLQISMMRGETEGGQIVLSAKRNVSEYTLEVADLSDGNGNVISADQIEVFHTKYIRIEKKTRYNENMAFRVGDRIPDLLLDMDVAVEHGENKIAKDENQSIYVDVTLPDDAVAGTYRGNFTLKIGGKMQQIPVSVNVWDICHEGKSDFQTVFENYTSKIAVGEFDCTGDIFRRYQRFASKYNVSLFQIKGNYTDYYTVEIPEYFENDRYNTISVPVFSVNQDFYTFKDGNTTASAQSTIENIKKLVAASTPENPYVEYAVCYHTGMDEADVWPYRWAEAERIYGAGGEVEQLMNEALRQLEEEGYYDNMTPEFAERVKHAVKYMPQILTITSFTDDAIGKFETSVFCPLIQIFNDGVQVGRLNEAAEKFNEGELWTYTCNGTVYPHQSFHIDDWNVGTRVAGWMYKNYGIDGYLYWAVDQYLGPHYDKYYNVYEESTYAAYANGEGMLFYPGGRYGNEYPFPSIRLVAFRDSVDDYDMLCVLEDLLNEYTEKYGIADIDVNDYVADLYATMYHGTDYYEDDALVYKAREELVSRILALQNDGLLATTNNANQVVVYSKNATLSFNGTAMNGTALAGDGYVYTPNLTDSTLTIKTDKSEFTYIVRSKVALDVTKTQLTEGSSASVNGSQVGVTMKSIDKGDDLANMRAKPYVQFECKPTDFNSVSFTLKNTCDKAISADIMLVYDSGVTKVIGGAYVGIGEEKSFRMYASEEVEIDFSRVRYVRFSFDNSVLDTAGNTVLFGTYTFDISNLIYDKK